MFTLSSKLIHWNLGESDIKLGARAEPNGPLTGASVGVRMQIHAYLIIPENCRFNLWEPQLNCLKQNQVSIILDDNILGDQWKAIEKIRKGIVFTVFEIWIETHHKSR